MNVEKLVHRRKLYTTGPILVSERVLSAMITDIGNRHQDHAYVTEYVR